MRLLALALLAGCFHVTHRPICEHDPEPIADDEEVAGWTGADLLAAVEGTRTEVGVLDEVGEVSLTVDVSRIGSAEYVHTTPGTHETRSLGFGSSHLMMYVHCEDFVRVPVSMRVTTEDEAVDITVESYATPPIEGFTDDGVVQISGDAALESATLPYGHADPADYDDPYAFTRVMFPSVEGPTTGFVGWGGSQETEDTHSSSAFYMLEW